MSANDSGKYNNGGLLLSKEKRNSSLCKAIDFKKDWYLYWCSQMKESPRFHRKQWEYIFILQALWERGCLQPGKRGMGFAVGTEPLPSVFASHGCDILATDIEPDQGAAMGWNKNNQLCHGLQYLYKCDIVNEEQFYKRVEYLPVDMNQIPDHLRNFDFNWSSCSFEHLGTIEKGIRFIKNQLDTLKPGGLAVHTTEYNISSNFETQDDNPTVIFRQRDIADLVDELRQEGHYVEELDFSLGSLPEDFAVDFLPHQQQIHIKLQLGDFIVTSLGLIIRKKC